MNGWREVIRRGKKQKSHSLENREEEGGGREKQKMTYFGEIGAWRDKRYFAKDWVG